MVKILALDISTTSTGYSLFIDGDPVIECCGKITMKHSTHGERLNYFESTVSELIIKHKPDIFYVEDIYAGINVKTYKLLALYHGIAYKLSYVYFKKDPNVMTPSEVRKVIADKFKIKLSPTKEQKALSINAKRLTYDFIISHFKIESFTFLKSNDITDGIALGLAATIRLEAGNERSI